jgi:hypothetical protein
MTDADKVREECREAKERGRIVTDAAARVIAMDWHGGQGSALYSFGSCGAIDDPGRLQAEIRQELLGRGSGDPAILPLESLLTYVATTGVRGAVTGWSKLWVK